MTDQRVNKDLAESSPPGRAAVCAAMLLTFVILFIQGGWPAPDVNESHYLAKAKHYWDPTWCQGDFFLESDDAHLVFYWTVGWLTCWLPLPAVAWVGRVVGWWLLACTWCRLSLALRGQPLLAPLSAGLFVALLDQFHMAGEWVVGGVEAKVFAYALVFLALEAVVRSRWNRVGLLLGGAMAFHVIVGGWSSVAIGVCWLGERKRPKLTSMIPGLCGGALLASFGLVPALALTVGTTSEVTDQANQIYVFERLPHHLAVPLVRDATDRLVRHGLLIAMLAALCWCTEREPMPDDRRRAMRTVSWFAWAAVLIATSGLVIAWATRGNPALGASLLRYYWFRLTDVAAAMAVALLGVGYLSILLKRRPRWGAAALAIALAIPLGHFAELTIAHWQNPSPRGDRHLANYDAWRDICDWVSQNTPPDACFLTPRLSQTFHWHAGRTEVVVRKNIPQNASAIVEWRSRIVTVHGWAIHDWVDNRTRPYYPNLTYRSSQELIALGERYGADYLLSEDERPLDLPLQYGNSTYAIYRLRP